MHIWVHLNTQGSGKGFVMKARHCISSGSQRLDLNSSSLEYATGPPTSDQTFAADPTQWTPSDGSANNGLWPKEFLGRATEGRVTNVSHLTIVPVHLVVIIAPPQPSSSTLLSNLVCRMFLGDPEAAGFWPKKTHFVGKRAQKGQRNAKEKPLKFRKH